MIESHIASRSPGTRIPVAPVVEREPLPRVVEAPGRVVEREEDDEGDRQEQVRERKDRVDGEQVSADELHPVSFSVPTTRA